MRHLALLLPLLATSAHAGETCVAMPPVTAGSATVAETELSRLYRDGMRVLERAPSLSETLAMRSPELCHASQLDGAHGYFDMDRNRIYISPALPKAMQLAVFVHETRHLHQIETGLCPSDALSMTEYAQAVFALEADASAISIMIAWDLKEQGDPTLWDALASWETQSDIASRFAGEMNASGDPGAAVSAAFDQWYASDTRRSRYYLSTCSEYLDRQDRTHAIPRYLHLPAAFYAELCKLPDGEDYPCAAPNRSGR
jgi:hypothetical protein